MSLTTAAASRRGVLALVRGAASAAATATTTTTSARYYSTAADKQPSQATYDKHGAPARVVSVAPFNIPTKLEAGQVLVRTKYASINPMDLNVIEGVYPTAAAKRFPGVVGGEREAVVEVEATGPRTPTALAKGTLAVPIAAGFGTWRTHAVVDHSQLWPVPAEFANSDKIPTQYYSALLVNPTTALRLLNDFVDLQPGDVVLVNGGASSVGHSLAQLAALKDVRLVSVINERPNFDNVVERLKSLGAHAVLGAGYFMGERAKVKRLLSDVGPVKLVLNQTGGDIVTEMLHHVERDATVVTYGGTSRQPVVVPSAQFIFNNIQMKGFWLERWIEDNGDEARDAMLGEVLKLMSEGKLKMFIEEYDFTDLHDALARAAESHRDRKVVLKFD